MELKKQVEFSEGSQLVMFDQHSLVIPQSVDVMLYYRGKDKSIVLLKQTLGKDDADFKDKRGVVLTSRAVGCDTSALATQTMQTNTSATIRLGSMSNDTDSDGF